MISVVQTSLCDLQDRLCEALSHEDGGRCFQEDRWERPGNGGEGRTRILADGKLFERAGVNFSQVRGSLPPAASARFPQLVGKPFAAVGVSVVLHPLNPYVPTAHLNVRFFCVDEAAAKPTWWFGGGFDLTPYYGFREDAVHWHQNAKAACDPFGVEYYPRFKTWCDEYFFLKHRGEARGIGGVFFDDFCERDFEHSFGLMKSVGDHFLTGYLPIVAKRKAMPYGERERAFQLYRRGRYVEFNLLYDRGTRFGLEFGGRIESILMSLPPHASWHYDWRPEPGSPEANLSEFLKPQNWLAPWPPLPL